MCSSWYNWKMPHFGDKWESLIRSHRVIENNLYNLLTLHYSWYTAQVGKNIDQTVNQQWWWVPCFFSLHKNPDYCLHVDVCEILRNPSGRKTDIYTTRLWYQRLHNKNILSVWKLKKCNRFKLLSSANKSVKAMQNKQHNYYRIPILEINHG
jgi:hypothetical protein